MHVPNRVVIEEENKVRVLCLQGKVPAKLDVSIGTPTTIQLPSREASQTSESAIQKLSNSSWCSLESGTYAETKKTEIGFPLIIKVLEKGIPIMWMAVGLDNTGKIKCFTQLN